RVEVYVLATDLVRVRMMPPHGRPPESPGSYAVVKETWPPARVHAEQTSQGVLLATERLRVHINTHPVRLSFYRPDGALICADAPGWGDAPAGGMGWRRGAVLCRKQLLPGEHFYGLGEKTGFLNHRGRRFTMWNTDVSPHLPDTDPLYASIPLLIGFREGRAYG